MQRILAEVTEHMEQQYSAHRYLEKLRSENETMAVREKERQVLLSGHICLHGYKIISNLTLKHSTLDWSSEN